MTTCQTVVLLTIVKGDDSHCAQLAREHRLDASGLSRLVDRFEASGLVTLHADLRDRHAVRLMPTARAIRRRKGALHVRGGTRRRNARSF
ncbi:MarR family transcriptional regulator [Paraburkholderia sp. BCC1886]|uniref:MarR family transcriptional regulator n=1 Tax=Paraburkholderia sp. BCC1886 TaxID=2562670 RepID=UPI00391FC06F